MAISTHQPCPYGRQSGRTQWMIDQICDAVADGQPKSRVFGHTRRFSIEHLKPRVIEGLQKRGLQVKKTKPDRIESEGSVIEFCGIEESPIRFRGTQGFGEFVDHLADGEQ